MLWTFKQLDQFKFWGLLHAVINNDHYRFLLPYSAFNYLRNYIQFTTWYVPDSSRFIVDDVVFHAFVDADDVQIHESVGCLQVWELNSPNGRGTGQRVSLSLSYFPEVDWSVNQRDDYLEYFGFSF
jgi:hypothetical protein